MLNYQFSKYSKGGESYSISPPLAEEPPPGKSVTYLGKAVVMVAALATFVCPPTSFISEVQAEIPVELGVLVVPLGPEYKSHYWNQGIPPGEVQPNIPVETGALVIPLGPEYKGQSYIRVRHVDHEPPQGKSLQVGYERPHPRPTFIGKTPPVPLVVAEFDELLASRKAVYSPVHPYYQERSYVQTPNPTETDELYSSRRVAYLPGSPYNGKAFVGTPLIPPDLTGDELGIIQSRNAQYIPPYRYSGETYVHTAAVPETITDDATQKFRFVTVPIPGDRGRTYVVMPQVPEIPNPGPDELPSSRRYIERRPLPPYNYLCLIAFNRPEEIDELIQSRRSQYIPPLPYRSRIHIGPIPPPILVEAPELAPSIRSIYTPIPPYANPRFAYTRQPDEIDELLQGKRFIVVPQPTYNGKTITVLPPVPEILVLEADELHTGKRRIYTPVFPYPPNLSRVQLPPVPAIIVVEAPELTISRVHLRSSPIPYPTNLTRVIYRQLDEPPPQVTVTGTADLALADFLIAPIRTPLYAKKLGGQIVIVPKDSSPWARWYSEVTKRIQQQRNLRVTLDFPPTAAQGYSDAIVTVIGAEVGDVVSLAVSPDAVLPNTSYFAFVSAANQVTIRFTNNHTALHQDPPSAEFGIIVQRL